MRGPLASGRPRSPDLEALTMGRDFNDFAKDRSEAELLETLDAMAPQAEPMAAATRPALVIELGDLPAAARTLGDMLGGAGDIFERGTIPVKLGDAARMAARSCSHSMFTA
jgi:hypothetical protein